MRTRMIKTIIRCPNNTVMVFDKKGITIAHRLP